MSTRGPCARWGLVFKMVIPIREGVKGLNEGLNEGLKSLLEAIQSKPGIKAKDLVAALNNRPIKTIERQIKELTEMEYIKRQGSKKTGGYHVIPKVRTETGQKS